MPGRTGFRLLKSNQLIAPLADASLTQLASAELQQIVSWKSKTIGEVLSNCWGLLPEGRPAVPFGSRRVALPLPPRRSRQRLS